MAGKGGGAWKVAYADFVTAMMAFFLVMWIVAQGKPVREAVASYFRDPFGTNPNPSGTGSGEGAAPIISVVSEEGGTRRKAATNNDDDPPGSNSTAQALAARKALLLKLHDGTQTSIGTTIQFADGSAELDDAARARLAEAAPKLRGKPNKIEVRGHATTRPLPADSPFHDTWELCYARCRATLLALVELGVEPERIRLSQAGPFEPQTRSTERESLAQNSRVDVYLLGEHTEDLKGTRKERDSQVGSHESPAVSAAH